MDIDEKKRKIDEVEEKPLNVDEVLKCYVESNTNMAKLLLTLTQKVLTFEKMFNKDLFK